MSKVYSDFFGPNVTLAAGLNADTTDTTVDLSGVPQSFIDDVDGEINANRPVPVRVGSDVASMEIMYLESYDSANDLWTVSRAQEGTSAKSHASGDVVFHVSPSANSAPQRSVLQSQLVKPSPRIEAHTDFALDEGALHNRDIGGGFGTLQDNTGNDEYVVQNASLQKDGSLGGRLAFTGYSGNGTHGEVLGVGQLFEVHLSYADENNWFKIAADLGSGEILAEEKVSGTTNTLDKISPFVAYGNNVLTKVKWSLKADVERIIVQGWGGVIIVQPDTSLWPMDAFDIYLHENAILEGAMIR